MIMSLGKTMVGESFKRCQKVTPQDVGKALDFS
jgi:hypothetical protein